MSGQSDGNNDAISHGVWVCATCGRKKQLRFPPTNETMGVTNQSSRAQSPVASRESDASLPVLPNELIAEILSRLPVKSLLQCKCVCKSWKRLISNPDFAKKHLLKSSADKHLGHHRLTAGADFVYEGVVSCSVRSLFDNPSTVAEGFTYHVNKRDYDYCWVAGSCHGLLCLAGFSWGDNYEQFLYQIWNPSTGSRSRDSPEPMFNYGAEDCAFVFGFGYDHLTETYKVVSIFCNPSAQDMSAKTKVTVHCLGDDSWRNIESLPAVPIKKQHGGEFVSGNLNWLATRNVDSAESWYSVTNDLVLIVALDMGTEEYKELLLPDGLDKTNKAVPTLGVLRDCLCVSQIYQFSSFVVWQMTEYGVKESWTKLVDIPYPNLDVDRMVWYPFLKVLCISENGDVLMATNIADAEILLYNRRDHTIKHPEIHTLKHQEFQSDIDFRVWHLPYTYVESLVSPS